MAEFPRTEQEERLDVLFDELTAGFKELEKLTDPGKQSAKLDVLKGKIQDAKALIKEFEREARTDGISPKELARRKAELVDEVNTFMSLRKTHANQIQSRRELLGGAQEGGGAGQVRVEDMSTQQVITKGRGEIQDIDNRLARAEKVVDDTIQIGVQTAAELAEQTKQMEKIVDDLDNIEFSLKKARKVLSDITRGLITDKFIKIMLLLVMVAVIVVVVLKIVDKEDDSFPQPRDIGVTRKLLKVEAFRHSTYGFPSSGMRFPS
ncbi:hypothetical protein BSKO_03094 [Bryopsis sp. KO-2023]|nr:hypothetical protein BSKO_03094 [Bryopsis sp. KO-2023]